MSESQKPPIHIKMKVGNVEFEVECREDQVKDVIEKVLSTITEYSSRTPPTEAVTQPRRAETCRGILERLWREGWFSTPKSLGEVHNEMMRIGFHYDRTAVSHTLLDLVRDGILTRMGRPRSYRYVQKRPPPEVIVEKKGKLGEGEPK